MVMLETRIGLLHQPRSSADGSADAGRHFRTDLPFDERIGDLARQDDVAQGCAQKGIGRYSFFNAMSGSTFAARKAGMEQAKETTISRPSTTETKIHGS